MQAAKYVPPPKFDIVVKPDGERVLVVPRGELDLGSISRLESEIGVVRARRPAAVVLDLRELTFMDSTGLRLLVQLAASADTDGYAFSIIDADGPVRRLLVLTQLRDRFEHAEP